ncbi:MAG TPA: hypothetical protein VHO70_20660 [Chitinispirillaceae bacterium]|nr:hypothetical protein [Chitinispirillaceae bacterium]
MVIEFKYSSLLLPLFMISIGEVCAGFDFKHIVNTGAALEHVYTQDELYSSMTYTGWHPQFFLGYTLNSPKNEIRFSGSYGFGTLHSKKRENVPFIDYKSLELILLWRRELFAVKPMGLTFMAGLSVSEWYQWKYFVLLENEFSNPFNNNIISAGPNILLKYTTGRHLLSAELLSPLLFCVSRRKEYNLSEYSSKIESVRSLQNFCGILEYTFQLNRRLSLSVFYQLHYMHYPACYKLNTSSDNVGLLIGFSIKGKNSQ